MQEDMKRQWYKNVWKINISFICSKIIVYSVFLVKLFCIKQGRKRFNSAKIDKTKKIIMHKDRSQHKKKVWL